MNTIIVPTDFSPASDNASKYAAELAQCVNATLVLLHVYQIPISINEMPVVMIPGEELKRNADEALQNAKNELSATYSNISIRVESSLGDLRDELEEFCKKENPLAVVIGTHHTSGFERLLFGDEALSIIRNVHYPVIAVPDKSVIRSPKNLALATDLLDIEQLPNEKVLSVVKALNAKLHIVHVEVEKKNISDSSALTNILQEAQPEFHKIEEDDVTEGINRFVQQNNIDLVLLFPHKHNLYERLFSTTHTREMLDKAPVPVMCINN
jgi:nucleotide-binding universal stress UspA family protein